MCQAYHVRPSELLAVGNSSHAFFVDRAVWAFASTVEREQEESEKGLPKKASEAMRNNARQRVLDKYLGLDPTKMPGRFRDPGTSRRLR